MNGAEVEKKALKLGYMPLSDCLPLLIAQEKGFFTHEGLDVELQQEVSWSNIRDKVIVGHLDGAHMLAPMLLASSVGLGGIKKPLITAFSLGLNGNALTVSNALHSTLFELNPPQFDQASTMKRLLEQRKQEGLPLLVFATVYPYSCHNLQLRYWLASADIDPDRDIDLVVLPPSQMVDHLKLQHIDGFFAGAPWNSVAILQGHGQCLLTSMDIWENAPEKVLGVTLEWAEENPNTHIALIKALYQACHWLESHAEQALPLLAQYLSINSPLIDQECLIPAITGEYIFDHNQGQSKAPGLLIFHRFMANFPWLSHGHLICSQMKRWHWLPEDIDCDALVASCYRPDIYRQALINVAMPKDDFNNEHLTLLSNKMI
ncbi:MAG: ABC-type nitrate/sulfonate/bicarbonate transport system substrate-binding protein [Marinobacter maritimus]|jgi:ABC-type nitrate/sulfonate/bicarbonate transport system substrate-binding protein